MARNFFLYFLIRYLCTIHCMKSVQIRSFFRSVFSRIRTEYGEIRYLSVLFSPNAGKYGPEKTPYLDTFHAVIIWVQALNSRWDSQINSIYLTNMIPTIQMEFICVFSCFIKRKLRKLKWNFFDIALMEK